MSMASDDGELALYELEKTMRLFRDAHRDLVYAVRLAVAHPGECLGDHPEVWQFFRAALQKAEKASL